MGKVIVILFCLITSCLCLPNKNELEAEFSKVLQKSLTTSIKNFIFFIQERVQVHLEPWPVTSPNKDRELNSTILLKALYNLKDFLPEQIPMIPFAVAEPTLSDILLYFGILNSDFTGITQFTGNASVNNTDHSTSIAVDLHLDNTSLKGHYELDVSNYNLHLYGDGNYSIIANGTDASITSNIEIFKDDSFLMSDFLVNVSINNAQLVMNNLLGGDPSAQQLTELVSQILPAEIIAMSDLIQQTVNSSIVDFTNSYLATIMTWSDVVSFIYDLADI